MQSSTGRLGLLSFICLATFSMIWFMFNSSRRPIQNMGTILPGNLITKLPLFTNRSMSVTVSGRPLQKNKRLFIRSPASSARLGNRMFVHAALIGIANSTGLQPAIMSADNHGSIESIFEITTPILTDNLKRVRTVEHEWKTSIYVPLPQNLVGTDDCDIQLTGYFQSWRYFSDVSDQVRREFQFREGVGKKAAEVMRRIMTKHRVESTSDVTIVGIHIRRADMANKQHADMGYVVADAGYLRRAMAYLEQRVIINSTGSELHNNSSIIYIVCSDDWPWVRAQTLSLFTEFPVEFSSTKWDEGPVALAIMASCNHTIITVGTFGWWAGYLSKGMTIFYNQYPKEGSGLAENFRFEDFYPPDWIGIR